MKYNSEAKKYLLYDKDDILEKLFFFFTYQILFMNYYQRIYMGNFDFYELYRTKQFIFLVLFFFFLLSENNYKKKKTKKDFCHT